MIALQLIDIKDFMSKLLLQTTFDKFLLVEANIITGQTFVMDGHLNQDFYSSKEFEEKSIQGRFSTWEELKPFCLSLIKGKRTPLSFKFTFQLSNTNTEKLFEQSALSFTTNDIHGLLLNIRYDGQTLSCTTGVSFKTFVLDKSLDLAWDSLVEKFLHQQQIPYLQNSTK